MKIYSNKSVLEAAKERISRLFDEFPSVGVSFSGGKDSTVVLNLVIEEATKRDRLPVTVFFLDQEAEYRNTIEYMRRVMTRPEVNPMWMQIPIRLFNATSKTDQWLHCWAPGQEWLRDKEPYALTENIYKTDRFHEMFGAITKKHYKDVRHIWIGGMRAEESPARFTTLQHQATYKDITYGKILDRKSDHYTFHPLYDWTYIDVWKAIHSHGWDYNHVYDLQYQYGVPVKEMRVSNLHHETAVHALFSLQEIEPDTYELLTQRIHGIDTAGKLNKADFFVHDLPYMFKDWRDYRDHLLENLVTEPEAKKAFQARFAKHDELYHELGEEPPRKHVQAILCNDYEMTKLTQWEKSPAPYTIRRRNQGKPYVEKFIKRRIK